MYYRYLVLKSILNVSEMISEPPLLLFTCFNYGSAHRLPWSKKCYPSLPSTGCFELDFTVELTQIGVLMEDW